VRALLAALPNEVLLDIVVGAVLTVLSYSSLAIVLLTATLAGSGMLPRVALGLVLGANLGSGLLALTTARATSPVRRLPLGNLLFGAGRRWPCRCCRRPMCWLQQPAGAWRAGGGVPPRLQPRAGAAVHRLHRRGGAARRALAARAAAAAAPPAAPPRPVALATPSLAISCAAREALHQADVVETMLRGMMPVIRDNDLQLAERCARWTTRSTSSTRRSSST
jgi:phosphate:Na+ symporter